MKVRFVLPLLCLSLAFAPAALRAAEEDEAPAKAAKGEDARASKDAKLKELVELGKRSVSEELVKEFETILAEADKLYGEIEKDTTENWISRRKQITGLR